MKILVADDEELAKRRLCGLIHSALPGNEVRGYCSPKEAIEEVRSGRFRPDIAFLDIEMPCMNGLELAKRLKDIHPWMNVIFVTAHPGYALEAFGLHPQGYLLKPASEERILEELTHLRGMGQREEGARLYIRCFGNFEVFSHGLPLSFRYEKSKELLAYLVDRRGAMVSSTEMCGILWEDRPDTPSLRGQMRKLFAELRKTLRAVGAEDVLIKRRNRAGIVVGETPCDYYSYLAGDVRAVNAYRGEYMSGYSWAEMTVGYLENHRK